jgi:predicted O-methyltransferase YrrM
MPDLLDRITRSLVRRVVRHGLVPPPEIALRAELQRRATMAAADFVTQSMPDALFCIDKFDHLTFAMSRAPAGVALEFGVFKGTTINHLARLAPDRRIYGFDSFVGLPEDWKGYRYSRVNFDRRGKKPRVASNVTLIEGWFQDTLAPFLAGLREPIAFLHLDCDIYASTKTVLELVAPRLLPNAVLVFDEFFNYKGYELHEYKAFFEFVAAFDVSHHFIGYSGQQVSVMIAAVRRPMPMGEGLSAGIAPQDIERVMEMKDGR